MRVTRTLMAPGSWQFSLRRDAVGTSVLRELRDSIATYDATTDEWSTVLDGYICVYSSPVATALPDIANADYIGLVLNSSGRATFGGEGLAALLNRSNGIGVFQISPGPEATRNLTTWMSDIFPVNGLTKGTVTMTGLSSVLTRWQVGVGAREFLTKVCQQAGGAEWRINTDLTVDAGPAGTLHDSGRVLITPNDVPSAGYVRGVDGSIIGFELDAGNTADRVHVAPAGEGETLTMTTAQAASAKGVTTSNARCWYGVAVDAPASDAGQASTLATNVLALRSTPRDTFRVRVADPYAFWYIAEGDTIYVHDPAQNVDGGNPLDWAGGVIYPQVKRVHSMSGPIPPDASVWLYRASGGWTNLTDAIEPTTGDTFLSVGQGAGPAAWAAADDEAWLGTTSQEISL